ncbi:hypothetical protein BCR42DRAFT_472399, partial [Absidia repens]
MTLFDQLPAEILSLIVNRTDRRDLYSCALINKKCNRATTPLFWKTVHVRSESKARLFLRALADASSSSPLGHYIRHIDLGDMMWSDITVAFLTQHVHDLKALYIRNGEFMTDLGFCSYLPRIGTHLTTLHLEQCYVTYSTITAIDQHCRPLKTLALINCKPSSPPPAAIAFLPLMHAHVEQFTLDVSKTAAAHMDWMEAFVATLLAGLPWLTHLTVSGNMGFSNVLERIVTASALRWPRLTHLSLGDDSELGDAPLVAFLHAHPHLVDVRLCHLSRITDATLDAISVVLPGITHLAVTHSHCLTAPRLRQLIRACPLLAFVSIEACGLFWYDFPELFHDSRCHRRVDDDTMVRRCGPLLFMEQLGQESLHCIRHAPHPPIALDDHTKSNNSSSSSSGHIG